MVLSESGQPVNGNVATVCEPGKPEFTLGESINCTGTLPKIWQKAFPPAPFELLPAVLSRRRDCLAMNWDSDDDDEEDVDNGDVAGEDEDNDLDAAFGSGILYSPVRSKTRTILEQPTPPAIPSTYDSGTMSSATLKCTVHPTEVEFLSSGHMKYMHKTESYTSRGTLSTALDIWPLPPPPPQFDDPTQVDEKTSRKIPDITKSKLQDNGADKCTSSVPIPVEPLSVEAEECADKVERCALTDPLTPLLQNCLQSTSVCICSQVNHLTTSIISATTSSCDSPLALGTLSCTSATLPAAPTLPQSDVIEPGLNPTVKANESDGWVSSPSGGQSPSFSMIMSPTPLLQPVPVPPIRLNVNRFGSAFSCGPPVPTIPEVEEEEEEEDEDEDDDEDENDVDDIARVVSERDMNNDPNGRKVAHRNKTPKGSPAKSNGKKDLKILSQPNGSVVHTTQPQAALCLSKTSPRVQSHSTNQTKVESNRLFVVDNEESEIEEDYPLLRPDYFLCHDRVEDDSVATSGLDRQLTFDGAADRDLPDLTVRRDFHVAVEETNGGDVAVAGCAGAVLSVDAPSEHQSRPPPRLGMDSPAVLHWLESTQVAVTIPRTNSLKSNTGVSGTSGSGSADSNATTTTQNSSETMSTVSNPSAKTMHEQLVNSDESKNPNLTKHSPTHPGTVLVRLTNATPGENLGIQIKPVFSDRVELIAQGFHVPDGSRIESGLEVHHVMPNGRVAREGFLGVGDRILSIDEVSLIGVPFEHGRDLFQAALKKPELTLEIQRKSARLGLEESEKKKSALPSCRLIIVPDMNEKAKEAEALSSGQTTGKPAPPPPPRRSPNTVLTRIPTGIIPPLIEEFLQEQNRTCVHTDHIAKNVPALPPKAEQKSSTSASLFTPPLSDCLSIQLRKGSNGLGFSLTSRELTACSSSSSTSVTERIACVKNILPGGAALLDGRLRSGDRLIQVDGLDVTKLGQANTVSLLREKPVNSIVNLLVWRSKDTESSADRTGAQQAPSLPAHVTGHTEVEKRTIRSPYQEDSTNPEKQSSSPTSPTHLPVNQLYKLYAVDPNQCSLLQLHINLPHTPTLSMANTTAAVTTNNGGASPPKSDLAVLSAAHPVTLGVSVSVRPLTNQPFAVGHHVNDTSNNAVFVRTVIEGGPAYLDGRLRVGDRMLTIDGEPLSGISSSDALNKLKTVIARDMAENRPHVCLLIARLRTTPAGSDEAEGGSKRDAHRASNKPHASNAKGPSSNRVDPIRAVTVTSTAMIVSADVHPVGRGPVESSTTRTKQIRSKLEPNHPVKSSHHIVNCQTFQTMCADKVDEPFLHQAKMTTRSKHGANLVNGLSNGSKKSVSRETRTDRHDRSNLKPPTSLRFTQLNNSSGGYVTSTHPSFVPRKQDTEAAVTRTKQDPQTEAKEPQTNSINNNNNEIQTAPVCLNGSATPHHVYRCDSQGTISSAEMPEDEARLSDCNTTISPELRTSSPASDSSTSSVSTNQEGSVTVLSDPETDRYSSLTLRRRHHHAPVEDGTRTLHPRSRYNPSVNRAPCRVIIRQPVIDLSQMVLVPFDAEAWSGPVLKPRSALTAFERAQLDDLDSKSSLNKETREENDLVSRNRRLFSKNKPGTKSRNRCDSTPSSGTTESNLTMYTRISTRKESNKKTMLNYDSDSGASHQSDSWTIEVSPSTKKPTVMSKLLDLVKSGTQRRSTHPDVTETTAGMHITRGTSTIQQPRHSLSDLPISTTIGDVAAKHADIYSARLALSHPVDRREEGKCDLKDSSIMGSTPRTTVGSAQTRLSEYCSTNSRPTYIQHVYHQAREAQSQTSPLSQSPIRKSAACITSHAISTPADGAVPKCRTQAYADLTFTDDACVGPTDQTSRISSRTVEVQTTLTKSTVNRLYDTDVSSCSTAYESVIEFLTPTEESPSPKLKTGREVYEDAEALYRCLADLKQSATPDEENLPRSRAPCDQIKPDTKTQSTASK